MRGLQVRILLGFGLALVLLGAGFWASYRNVAPTVESAGWLTHIHDVLATEVAAELQERAPERRVDLVIAPGAVARADPRLVRVLFENLLGNARKYTRHRDPARIEFGIDANRGSSTYYIRDNGAGFDMAYVDRLFGAFQRLHSHSEFEGTGIGLATVQRIVRRHGGRVWAQGAVDRGATFSFTL